MAIRKQADVRLALALFVKERGQTVWASDAFVELCGELHFRNATRDRSAVGLYRAVSALSAEHSTLLTILERNEWQKKLAAAGHLDHTLWLFFATLDVEHYFVALRSTFDQLARALVTAAPHRGQCPTSFEELFRWCTEHPERASRCLGPELRALVLDCDWFHSVRATRDSIVHFGALTIAFPTFETVSFQVYAGKRSAIVPAEIMTNANIADFELFMAWTLGNLSLTMTAFASLVLDRLRPLNGLQVRSYRIGSGILYSYLERLETRLG